MLPRFALFIAAALTILMAGFLSDAPSWGISAAWAGDDEYEFEYESGGVKYKYKIKRDDGEVEYEYEYEREDDDDDDDSPRRRAPRAAQSAPSTPPAPLPDHAPDEVIANDLTPEAVESLLELGFTVARQIQLGSGRSLFRLKKPADVPLAEARNLVQDLSPIADYNHYYRPGRAQACRGTNCPAREMIAWPEVGQGCGIPPRIGMVDTDLNAAHTALQGARITVHHIAPDAESAPSDRLHGTAVAALLVGQSGSRTQGLVPQAELIAVNAFHKQKNDERTDAFTLIEALDYLTAQGVDIINLSLAGPANDALGAQINHLDAAGIVLVAAAGNGGPAAAPAYPAAYEQVIAVTAIDRRSQVYRRANRGDHINLAAPGVDVWTAASISGGRNKTGTSFAAPFVTAAAALLMQQQPGLSPLQVRARLQQAAQDLGDVGPDDVFGYGLVTPVNPCLPATQG